MFLLESDYGDGGSGDGFMIFSCQPFLFQHESTYYEIKSRGKANTLFLMQSA